MSDPSPEKETWEHWGHGRIKQGEGIQMRVGMPFADIGRPESSSG